MRNLTLVVSALTALVFSSPSLAHDKSDAAQPAWQTASKWPDRITVTFKGAPQTGFAVTWRTDDSVKSAKVQIVEARAAARFHSDGFNYKGGARNAVRSH